MTDACGLAEMGTLSTADFYIGKTVFITGSTGFIGKALVAKLLLSCPSIRMIYLLIRPRKEQNASERLEHLLNSPAFDETRCERPWLLQKIHAIEGDVMEPLLGISTANLKMLISNVNIVFHVAATVKFNEPLKIAISINFKGTQRVVELCKNMTRLEALVYVSTAYANCDRANIEEVIYTPSTDPDLVITLVEGLDQDIIELITPHLLGNHPNTYTFSKALTEKWLSDHCVDLPLVIVRPSVVMPSIAEPCRGWTDTWNGLNAIIAGVGNGICRSVYGNCDMVVDLIPVDMVVNLMLVTACRVAIQPTGHISIYNSVSGLKRAITWNQLMGMCLTSSKQYPSMHMMWYPNARYTSSRLVHVLTTYFLQYLPAYVFDVICSLMRRKRIYVRIQTKLALAAKSGEFFSSNEWIIEDRNVRMLIPTLSDRDRQDFCFDASTITWDTYIEGCVLGIRRFMIKDEPSTIGNARKKLSAYYWCNRLLQMTCPIAIILGICVTYAQLRKS